LLAQFLSEIPSLITPLPISALSGGSWRLTPVVDLIIARINGALEQLIDLLLAHLLAQVCQNVLDLALPDEAAPVLVEDLEAADVFFDVKGFAEAAGAVEDLGEGFEVDCSLLLVSVHLQVCGVGARRLLGEKWTARVGRTYSRYQHRAPSRQSQQV
jgi:hypothetical protein